MGLINVLDAKTTKQLSTMLLAAGGALTFSAFNMVAAGVGSGNQQFAADVSSSFAPLVWSLSAGLMSFLMAVLADQPSLSEGGGRWSKSNLLETAFALLVATGLGGLVWATAVLFSAARITVN